jgi:hypothetical protein
MLQTGELKGIILKVLESNDLNLSIRVFSEGSMLRLLR